MVQTTNSNKPSTKKDNKKTIIISSIVCVILIIIVVLAVVLIVNNTSKKGSDNPNDDQSFFESDDEQYVISYDLTSDSDEETTGPIAIKNVYDNEGDNVTGLKMYYEYSTEQAAKNDYDYYGSIEDVQYKSIKLDGKFIVFTFDPEGLKGLTMTEVKKVEQEVRNNSSKTDDSETTPDVVETEVVDYTTTQAPEPPSVEE